MLLKIYRDNRFSKQLAMAMLVAMAAFSVNFLMAYVCDCSVNTVLMSEEKKSDGEPESEKESENKLEDFYSEVYSLSPLHFLTSKLPASAEACSQYTSFYSKIATPPPKA